MAIATCICALF